MPGWYAEDLLDHDFAAQDSKTLDAKITNGQAGSWPGYTGSGLGRYLQLMAAKDAKFDIVAAPYPVLAKGERPFSGQRDNPYPGDPGSSITPKCKYPVEAAKWLDYSYGDEGYMLNNFGIEGVSYTMVNGYPKYTDAVMKNPDGLAVGQAIGKWARSSYGGPFVQDARYMEQYLAYPQQRKAVEVWSVTDAALHRMPPVTLVPEESTKYASVMNQVNTFRNEMFLKFVMNQRPLAEFDAYVAELKKMGIDQAIAIQQAALDRFNAR